MYTSATLTVFAVLSFFSYVPSFGCSDLVVSNCQVFGLKDLSDEIFGEDYHRIRLKSVLLII